MCELPKAPNFEQLLTGRTFVQLWEVRDTMKRSIVLVQEKLYRVDRGSAEEKQVLEEKANEWTKELDRLWINLELVKGCIKDKKKKRWLW